MRFFEILIIATGFATVKAEVDCTKIPSLATLIKCCEYAEIFSDSIRKKCTTREYPKETLLLGGEESKKNNHGLSAYYPKLGPSNDCFLGCIINETGILVDGYLQINNVKSYLNEHFDDPEKVKALIDIFIICNEERKNIDLKWPDDENDPTYCPAHHGEAMIICVQLLAFIECPDAVWVDTEECIEASGYMSVC